MINKGKGWKLGLLVTSVIMGLSLITGACAPAEAPPSPAAPTTSEVKVLGFVGASIGGKNILIANMEAAMVKKFMDIDGTVISYPTNRNADALILGEADIGADCYPVFHEMAWTGTDVYEGEEPYKELRVLTYNAEGPYCLMVMEDSPIKTFRDLAGKKLGVGKTHSVSAYSMKAILKALGMTEDVELVYAGWAESQRLFITGVLDAFWQGGFPHPAMEEVDLAHPLTVVPLTEEDMEIVTSKVGFLSGKVVEPRAYHMTESTLVPTLVSFIDTTVNLPEWVAHDFTKTYLEHPDFIKLYYNEYALQIEEGIVAKLNQTMEGRIPFHVGAIRYFKEIGLEIQPGMYPPEWKG